ncbi:RDD family protein [Ideonella sp. DXS22W]|uniref:RDD family protein n=1 Tax=Pseudaquabacterium inlustre TaxID=2984192 RepID=A0ABU9CJV1_9BURK
MALIARGPGPRERVSAEDLNVAPALLGRPLAGPGRRAAAIAIDGLWIAAFHALGNVWVALALAALLLWQRARRRVTAGAPADAAPADGAPAGRPWRATLLAAALLCLGALTEGDGAGDAASGAASATWASPAASPPQQPIDRLQARIAAQDAELQRLRSPGLGAWQARARHWLDELGEGWVWSLAYFMLLPAGWLGGRPGQTLGKRWLGLCVAELTGKPMTPMRNLKRYGGYAAGMATGGLGLLQLLWDGNRQAIQDKTAHTVVLDLRRH